MLVHVCQCREFKTGAGFIMGLNSWADPAKFKKQILKKAERKRLGFCLRVIRDLLSSLSVVEMSTDRCNRRIRHIYTDAADPCKPFVGGVCMGVDDEPNVAFSIEIKNVPAWVRAVAHIGIFEAIAVDLGRELFREYMIGFWNIMHVDNAGDCFSLSSGTSRCMCTQVIVESVIRGLDEADLPAYFAYIKSERNCADNTTRLEKIDILDEMLKPVYLSVDESAIPWDKYKAGFLQLAEVRSAPEPKVARRA